MTEINLMSGRTMVPFPLGVFKTPNDVGFCGIMPPKQGIFFFIWRASAGPRVQSVVHSSRCLLVNLAYLGASCKCTPSWDTKFEAFKALWVQAQCQRCAKTRQAGVVLLLPSKSPVLIHLWHKILCRLAVQPSPWPCMHQVVWKETPLGWLQKLSVALSEFLSSFFFCLHLLKLLSK